MIPDTALPLFAAGPRIDVSRLEDTDERAVASLLNTRVGADAAMQVRDVAANTGIPTRRVQSIVQRLIHEEGAPIGTSMRKPYGWYLIESREEHEAVVALHRSRAMTELRTMAGLDRTAVRGLIAQVQTELLEDVA